VFPGELIHSNHLPAAGTTHSNLAVSVQFERMVAIRDSMRQYCAIPPLPIEPGNHLIISS
jgi:hypothetical protein